MVIAIRGLKIVSPAKNRIRHGVAPLSDGTKVVSEPTMHLQLEMQWRHHFAIGTQVL